MENSTGQGHHVQDQNTKTGQDLGLNYRDNARDVFNLSKEAGVLLNQVVRMGGEFDSVTFTEGMSKEAAEKANTALGEIIHYNFAKLALNSTKVVPTPAGIDCVSRGYGLVYPFGVNGTINSYNKTLLTQSSAAKNALLTAMARLGPSYFDKSVERRKLSALVQMFVDVGLFTRLYPYTNINLDVAVTNCLKYYSERMEPNRAADFIEEKMQSWSSHLDDLVLSKIEEMDGFTPSDVITFGALQVVSVSKEANVKVEEMGTNVELDIDFNDLPYGVKCEILRQAGA